MKPRLIDPETILADYTALHDAGFLLMRLPYGRKCYTHDPGPGLSWWNNVDDHISATARERLQLTPQHAWTASSRSSSTWQWQAKAPPSSMTSIVTKGNHVFNLTEKEGVA